MFALTIAGRCTSILALALAVCPLGCGGSPSETASEDVASRASAITSGTPDDTDGSVVWIVAKVGKQTGYCSGVVVSPHVVLTAAHCSQMDATYSIFLGADYTDQAAQADSTNYVAVTEHHANPKFATRPGVVHDVGVLVTQDPIPRPAAPLNRAPFTRGDVDEPIRIVGFGQTSGDDETIGRRHQATAKLADYDANSLQMDGSPSFCLFDSGGPTFMQEGGHEVVVGIHSVVESTSCDQAAWDERVDVNADFIDAAIAQADPPPEDAGRGVGDDAGAAPTASDPTNGSGCSMHPRSRPSGGLAVFSLVACAVVAAGRRRLRRTRARRT